MADFKRRAFDFYTQMGYQPHQAAALAGNAAWESSGRTDIRGDGGKALGLFQWHPDRQDNLNKFATQYGLDPKSEATQLQFADWELKNTESAAGNKLLAANDLKTANDAVLSYLRPSGFTPDNPMGGHGYVGRYNNAAGLLNEPAMAQALAMPPPKHIGAPNDPAMAQAAQPTAGQEIDPVYGSVVKPGGNALGTDPSKPNSGLPGNGGAYFPATPAKGFNNAGLIGSGLSLMAAGEAPPPQQASWMGNTPMPQAHRGDAQMAGLLTDLMKKKNLFGGLLGEF